MGLREELLKRIERKQEEIRELELKIREGQAYLLGLQDTLKILPRDTESGVSVEPTLRPGTGIAKARDAIRAAGRPLHISELLKAAGRSVSKESRAGLSGSLAAYVRRHEIFTRPAPNTFGLIELEQERRVTRLPENFGKIAEEGVTYETDDEPKGGTSAA
jgi:hypothetical protein